jgi:hypothetical protein
VLVVLSGNDSVGIAFVELSFPVGQGGS